MSNCAKDHPDARRANVLKAQADKLHDECNILLLEFIQFRKAYQPLQVQCGKCVTNAQLQDYGDAHESLKSATLKLKEERKVVRDDAFQEEIKRR